MKRALLNFTKKIDIVLIILLTITLICCGISFGHLPLPMYDVGREAYLPQRILEGQVLYKDILNLFGPFSYLLTALIYKLLGSNLETLFIIGCTCAVLLISGIYELSKIMLDRKIACIITLLSIIIGVFCVNHCNASYILPYSHAMVYGTIATVWSVYFLIKSEKQQNKPVLYKCIAAFLAGISFINKYEFAFAAFFIVSYIVYDLFRKNKKGCVAAVLSFIMPIVTVFGYLLHQGLTLSELYNSFIIIKNIVQTHSYQNYYRKGGTLFLYENFKLDLIEFIKFSIFSALYFFSVKLLKQQNDWGSILFIVTTVILVNTFYINLFDHLSFLPILIILLFIFSYKNLDKTSKIFIITTILLEYKVLWMLSLRHYGVFFAPFTIISLFLMIKDKFKNTLILFLIVTTLLMFNRAIFEINYTATSLATYNHPLFVNTTDARKINRLIFYIMDNTKPDDKIIIYPENIIVNYITGRKTDDFYYQMGPAYMEQFGEENIIKHFKETKPEYFVFTSDTLPEYNHTSFCESYAQEFCKFVQNNYNGKILYNNIEQKDKVIVYKRKDLKYD